MPELTRGPEWFKNDSQWCGFTLGEFISLMVDGGDSAVIARIVKIGESDETGNYIQRMEIVLVPNGLIAKTCKEMVCLVGDSRFIEAMDKGLLK